MAELVTRLPPASDPDRAATCFMHGPGVDLVAFDASGPSVGVWDQFLKLGRFVKQGVESVFDAETVAQILDNWAGQKNDLWLDRGHDMDKALAYYNALVFVVDGAAVRYEPHSGAPSCAPTSFDLRRGRPMGWAPPDGIYGYRYHVTELGADPIEGLRNYKYVSPAFSKNGRDEQERPIGYVIYNAAATNIPFLDDVTLAYSKKDPAMADKDKSDKDDESCYVDAGVDDKDDDKEKMRKLSVYAAGLKGKLKKYEDNPFPPKKDKDEDEEDEDKKKEKMTRSLLSGLGLPADLEMARAKLQTYQKTADEFGRVQAEIADLQTYRKGEEARKLDGEATTFAKGALDKKRWDPEHKGDRAKTEAWLVEQYKKSPVDAESMLHPEGRFGLSKDSVRQRYSTRGELIGGANPRGSEVLTETRGKGAELNRAAWALVRSAKESGNPITYAQALGTIERTRPDLLQSYERDVIPGATAELR